MNLEISDETKIILNKLNMKYEAAKIEQLEEILELYKNRTIWFKDNNIKQWSKYLIRHESEFPVSIENKNYYILKKDNEIIAGFELCNNPGSFIDNNESLYLNKIVTKVGYKNIGDILFRICKDIAQNNGKRYLRLICIKWNEKLNEIYDKHGFKLIGYGKTDYEFCLRELDIKKV